MQKDDLKCILIGRDISIYNDLARLVRSVDSTSRFKQLDHTQSSITHLLKKISGSCLVFISDEVSFSLELLSDLVWQYCPDAIIVIVTKKSKNVAIKQPFNNTQFSRLKLTADNTESTTFLRFIIQLVREKAELRRCKSFLGISEKRCQWLVESSHEAIAFISRDMHWFANTVYLNLFEIPSIRQLRSVTLKDLIVADEHRLFDEFKRTKGSAKNTNTAITLSMQKQNGVKFRANIDLIPSVFKGSKCLQLWVRELSAIDSELKDYKLQQTSEEASEENVPKPFSAESQNNPESFERNPFSSLLLQKSDPILPVKKQPSDTIDKSAPVEIKRKTYSYKSLLKGVIQRKEAKIVGNKLSYLKMNKKKVVSHQLLSLKVATAQKQGVDDLLESLPVNVNSQMRAIFWDKVKLSRLLQILVKRQRLSVNLLLRLNEASITDQSFIDWLMPGLKRIGRKSSQLTFLIPTSLDQEQRKNTLTTIKKLKSMQCKIALDSFFATRESLQLLKATNPKYVRLSLPWVRQFQGDEAKEIRLSSLIRQLEEKNIKVIVPCSFSKEMRKLFILSGASFCQESPIYTD